MELYCELCVFKVFYIGGSVFDQIILIWIFVIHLFVGEVYFQGLLDYK